MAIWSIELGRGHSNTGNHSRQTFGDSPPQYKEGRIYWDLQFCLLGGDLTHLLLSCVFLLE